MLHCLHPSAQIAALWCIWACQGCASIPNSYVVFVPPWADVAYPMQVVCCQWFPLFPLPSSSIHGQERPCLCFRTCAASLWSGTRCHLTNLGDSESPHRMFSCSLCFKSLPVPFLQSKNQPHRRGEYNVYSTFQSHEPEFDYLKSLEIEEKINKIRWLPQQNAAYFLLSTNGMWPLGMHQCCHGSIQLSSSLLRSDKYQEDTGIWLGMNGT